MAYASSTPGSQSMMILRLDALEGLEPVTLGAILFYKLMMSRLSQGNKTGESREFGATLFYRRCI